MIVKSVEKKENNTVNFVVDVDAAEFEKALNAAYLKNRKDIYIPGFRKGKAPRMVIEGMYGKEVFYEDAINEVAPEAFTMAVKEADVRVVGRPSITETNVSDEKVLTLSFESALYPEVTLGEYKGLEAEKKVEEVTDEQIDADLARTQKRNSRTVNAERPAAMGDTVTINFEGFKDGVAFEGGKAENFDLPLGSGQFIPGFEEQIVGMSIGDEKDINVTFPEDYQSEELKGQPAVFHVKVNEIKEIILPELDDEFAKDVSEFDTLEEYKNSIREKLAKQHESAAEEDFHNSLLKKAVDNMTVVIPDAMIDAKQEDLIENYSQNLAMQGISLKDYLGMMGMDEEIFRKSARPAAIEQLHNELLLAKIAEVEAFELTDEEIDAEFAAVAANYEVDVETVKKAIPVEQIKDDLKMRKASELIFSTGIAVAPAQPAEEPEKAE